jgi:hypothetical protein
MLPAPIVMADQTRKKIIGAPCLVSIVYWRRGTLVRQYSHRLTVRCASPIRRKGNGNIDETDIDRHSPKPSSNTSQLPDPPHSSLVTTVPLKIVRIAVWIFKYYILLYRTSNGTGLHFVIITDKTSLKPASSLIKHAIQRHVVMNMLRCVETRCNEHAYSFLIFR